MKNKSLFYQIMLLIVVSLVCIILTIGIALFAGSLDTTILDLKNLNVSNIIPILIVGGFISCVVVGIFVLFISRSVFFKLKNYFSENNKDGGNEE